MTEKIILNKRSSFADKLRAGWTPSQLVEYYGLSPEKYERILASLKNIEEYHDRG